MSDEEIVINNDLISKIFKEESILLKMVPRYFKYKNVHKGAVVADPHQNKVIRKV